MRSMPQVAGDWVATARTSLSCSTNRTRGSAAILWAARSGIRMAKPFRAVS